MSKTIKNLWNAATTVILIVVVLLAFLLAGARLFGLQVFCVLSGSMEPIYQTGALIYVKETDPFTIENGQVITFMIDEDTIATHRVVEIVPDEEDPSVVHFRTKGDANDNADGSLVHCKNVLGTPVYTIPKLGYLANYIQNPPGTYIAISVGAILMLLMFLPDLLFDDDKKTAQTARSAAARPQTKTTASQTRTVSQTRTASQAKTSSQAKTASQVKTTQTGTAVPQTKKTTSQTTKTAPQVRTAAPETKTASQTGAQTRTQGQAQTTRATQSVPQKSSAPATAQRTEVTKTTASAAGKTAPQTAVRKPAAQQTTAVRPPVQKKKVKRREPLDVNIPPERKKPVKDKDWDYYD